MNQSPVRPLRRAVTSPWLITLFVIGASCWFRASTRGTAAVGILDRLELVSYDWRVRWSARFAPTLANNLGLVYIDDGSVDALKSGMDGALPYSFGLLWPRQVYGRLVRELHAQGALAMALNIVFSDPRPDHPPVRGPGEEPTGSDEFFAREMAKAGNVILGAELFVVPCPLFFTNAWRVGSLTQRADADGVTRRVPAFEDIPVWHPLIRQAAEVLGWGLAGVEPPPIGAKEIRFRGGDPGRSSLALDGQNRFDEAGLQRLISRQSEDPPEPRWVAACPMVRIWNMGILLAARALRLDLDHAQVEPERGRIVLRNPDGLTRIIRIDAQGCLLVDWRVSLPMQPPQRTLTIEAIEQLLLSDVRREKGTVPTQDNFLKFRDKLVVVGSISGISALANQGQTPLQRNYPMLVVPLNVANAILTDRQLKPCSFQVECLLIALLGVGAACGWRAGWIRGGAVVAILSSLYFCVAGLVFVHGGHVVPVTQPIFTALALAPLPLLLKLAHPLAAARRFFARAGFGRASFLHADLIQLSPGEGQSAGLVALWPEQDSLVPETIVAAVKSQHLSSAPDLRLYLIYRSKVPSGDAVQAWRRQLGCEVIPVSEATLERASFLTDHGRILREIEEPYVVRTDPYADFKPITDPVWFYGRGELMQRLPAALAQGQHVGLFGLRKVGKTSVANQLRHRFGATPCVLLDCQGLSAKAERFLDAIYRETHEELRARDVRGLPKLQHLSSIDEFSPAFESLFERWKRAQPGHPILLVFDEIDKFFPNPEVKGRDEILLEYVRVFRVLRSLAQTRQCLVVLAIAYRPTVNRQNLLTPQVGENPMFNSFQEHNLGALSPADSTALVRELGLWKSIVWEEEAAREVFSHCGGHPLITRYFASHACRKGTLKRIDVARTAETVQELEITLRKNEIGNYYKEGVWELLSEPERHLLSRIGPGDGLDEGEISTASDEALSNLERFGLVGNAAGRVHVTAGLLRTWLRRRGGS